MLVNDEEFICCYELSIYYPTSFSTKHLLTRSNLYGSSNVLIMVIVNYCLVLFIFMLFKAFDTRSYKVFRIIQNLNEE